MNAVEIEEAYSIAVLLRKLGKTLTSSVRTGIRRRSCGTGGFLSITNQHIPQINPQAKVMRWQFNLPLRHNTNFTLVRHFIDSSEPQHTSAFILATL